MYRLLDSRLAALESIADLARSLSQGLSDDQDCYCFLFCAHHEIEYFWATTPVSSGNTTIVVFGNNFSAETVRFDTFTEFFYNPTAMAQS
jgi:hypothetical protein